VVAVVVNRSLTAGADADIDLTGLGTLGDGRVFQYRGGREGLVPVGQGLPKVGSAGMRMVLPPASITVLEMAVAPR
jgi:hypothetical protein